MKFKISGNPISSKNSRPIFINKATEARFIGKSEKLREYIKDGLIELKLQKRNFDKDIFPLTADTQIIFRFFCKDKRKRDLVNLCQAPLDLLQGAEIIKDDSIVKSIDGTRIYIDKENPRTEIIIKKIENNN